MSKRQNLPIPELSERDKKRFAAMIDTSEGQGPNGDCHTWKGAKTNRGYPTFSIADKTYFAHRIALKMATGSDPGELLATHQCDFPGCVRGEHLKPGTHKSNAQERIERGRYRINPNAPDAHHNGRAATVNKQQIKRSKRNEQTRTNSAGQA